MIGFIGCSGCLQRSAGILQGDEHNQKRLLAKIHRKIGLTVSFCVFFFQRPFGLGTSQVSKLPELHFFNFFTTAFQCRAAARGGFGLGEGHGLITNGRHTQLWLLHRRHSPQWTAGGRQRLCVVAAWGPALLKQSCICARSRRKGERDSGQNGERVFGLSFLRGDGRLASR
jgi:hypothetical protein